MNNLDGKDNAILSKYMEAREQISRPRMGDYVLFPTGELERFSHNWGNSLQTSPSGSFFLCSNGEASFSGGLNPSTPMDKLTLTDKTLPGSFWFFHHGVAGAGCGVYFDISCRVYTTTAVYEGFLGENFLSHKTKTLKNTLAAELELIAERQKGIPMEDLSKCPQCGGDADNGIDNCIQPSAYMCRKCCAQENAEKAGCTDFDERPEDPHLPEFHEAIHAGYKGTFYEWHKDHFGTFWCPGVAA